MRSFHGVPRLLAAIALVVVPCGLVLAEEPAAGKQVKQTLEAKVPADLRPDYWLYLPEKYEAGKGKHWPLMLFLHGAGERGDDNRKQLIHGLNEFAADEIRKKHPAFVVAPQYRGSEGGTGRVGPTRSG